MTRRQLATISGVAVLLLALCPTASAAVGQKWPTFADHIHVIYPPFVRNQTYTIRVTTVDPGAVAIIHVWDARARTELGQALAPSTLDHGIEVGPPPDYERRETYFAETVLDFTMPATATVGYVAVIVRALDPSTAGIGSFSVEGPGYYYHEAPIEFGGTAQALGESGVRNAVLATSALGRPSAPQDTILLVTERDRLVAVDQDSGVGYAAQVTLDRDSADLTAIVGTTSFERAGVFLLANDVRLGRDEDRDGLGDELEEALGACADRTPTPPLCPYPCPWDCSRIPDAADSDEDGIRDDAEVFGIAEVMGSDGSIREPAVLLPYWGAARLHKDVFVEVDWCIDYEEGGMPAADNACRSPTDDRFNRRMFAAAAARAAEQFAPLPADSVRNPDGRDGVALHLDIGRDGPECRTGSRCGTFGGAGCLSRVRDGAGGAYRCPDYEESYPTNIASNRRPVFHYAVVPGGSGWVNYVFFGTSRDAGDVTAHELGHNLNLDH